MSHSLSVYKHVTLPHVYITIYRYHTPLGIDISTYGRPRKFNVDTPGLS